MKRSRIDALSALSIAAGTHLFLTFFEKVFHFIRRTRELEFENPAPAANRDFQVASSESGVLFNFRDQCGSHQEELYAGAAGGFARNWKVVIVDLINAVVEAPHDAFERSRSEEIRKHGSAHRVNELALQKFICVKLGDRELYLSIGIADGGCPVGTYRLDSEISVSFP